MVEHTNWTDPAGLFWSTIGLPDGRYVILVEQAAPLRQTDQAFAAWESDWRWRILCGLALVLILLAVLRI